MSFIAGDVDLAREVAGILGGRMVCLEAVSDDGHVAALMDSAIATQCNPPSLRRESHAARLYSNVVMASRYG